MRLIVLNFKSNHESLPEKEKTASIIPHQKNENKT